MESEAAQTSLFTKQNFVSRLEWNALSPKTKRQLRTPVKYVILSYTNSLPCESKEECITRVQDIQSCNIHSCQIPDIKSNFLIGGDGRIYEGRGWSISPQKNEIHHKLFPINNKFIEIAFIGKNGSHLSEDMGKAAAIVIQEGINKNIFDKDIKVTTIWLKHIIPKAFEAFKNIKISRHVDSNDPKEDA